MSGKEEMDMLNKIKEGLDTEGKSPLEALAQISELLNKLELSEEEKEQLKQTLNDKTDQMSAFMKPGLDILPDGNLTMTITLVVAFVVVMTLFVFFGYKLYRSLTEKERKRDEKRKQKQMKKKK
ncbi:hypothetical protein RI129_003776 [Pyrocoelia pectoralis]|uniref:Uncharacterized protein n=1 Tax=Pyrocoelia pectoralis TaxID=417401 RepID=A0AAN7VS00_9COLE